MSVAKYIIKLTEEERTELKRIVRKHTSGQSVVRRAKIILMADEGTKRMAIARELGIAQENVVTTWIKRWLEMSDRPITERLVSSNSFQTILSPWSRIIHCCDDNFCNRNHSAFIPIDQAYDLRKASILLSY